VFLGASLELALLDHLTSSFLLDIHLPVAVNSHLLFLFGISPIESRLLLIDLHAVVRFDPCSDQLLLWLDDLLLPKLIICCYINQVIDLIVIVATSVVDLVLALEVVI
jgi:hypothetical protein